MQIRQRRPLIGVRFVKNLSDRSFRPENPRPTGLRAGVWFFVLLALSHQLEIWQSPGRQELLWHFIAQETRSKQETSRTKFSVTSML